METALLVGLSRQMAARRNMDVIANNLANMTTTSFKAESVIFEEYLVDMTNEDGSTSQVSMVLDRGTSLNFSEGRMDPTNNPFDLAISGEGFFVVETFDGDRYTRNGHLGTNEEGLLVDGAGHPVLNMDGDVITLRPEDGIPSIAHDGTLTTREGNVLDRINLVSFEDTSQMEKVGDSLYTTDQAPMAAENAGILQGTIETSNVVPILEMTRMISVSRAYQSISKMIETSDQLTRDTIRRLADTSA